MKNTVGNRPIVSLIKPDLVHEHSFRSGFAELETASDKFSWIYLGEASYEKYFSMDFSDYVRTLRLRETEAPPNFVCDTVYWAIVGGEVAGRIAIRHELTEFLKTIGGHVGYIVRPSSRGKGIGTEMLRQILSTDRARQIGNILVTCDEHNTASERTIIKCGGVLQDVITVDPSKPRKKRFWISQSTHFILYVKDQGHSRDFYSSALSAKPILDVPGMTEFILPGGAVLGLMPEDGIKKLLGNSIAHPGEARRIARSELYLRVPSPADYHTRALTAGAKELSPLQNRSWGDIAAYSEDPDGHVLVFAKTSNSPME
jgi:predicted acetyltransferase